VPILDLDRVGGRSIGIRHSEGEGIPHIQTARAPSVPMPGALRREKEMLIRTSSAIGVDKCYGECSDLYHGLEQQRVWFPQSKHERESMSLRYAIVRRSLHSPVIDL
jgi:hypothetical protein